MPVDAGAADVTGEDVVLAFRGVFVLVDVVAVDAGAADVVIEDVGAVTEVAGSVVFVLAVFLVFEPFGAFVFDVLVEAFAVSAGLAVVVSAAVEAFTLDLCVVLVFPDAVVPVSAVVLEDVEESAAVVAVFFDFVFFAVVVFFGVDVFDVEVFCAKAAAAADASTTNARQTTASFLEMPSEMIFRTLIFLSLCIYA